VLRGDLRATVFDHGDALAPQRGPRKRLNRHRVFRQRLWPAGSGLALDQHGFIATALTLQSTSHPEVFAAGDVASSVALQRPKSGVFAVRAGPPLALNLRRYLGAAALQEHLPKLRSLNLLACGRRSAIVAWGSWSAQSALAWYWKDWIDRRFVAKYR
jgi:NADH dehydrogenase FAD-containing subunit